MALDYLESTYGTCERIASYYGQDSSIPTNYGTGLGRGQFLQRAFVVYKFPANSGRLYDWYLLMQVSWGNLTFDLSNNLINGNSNATTGLALGFQVAIALDSAGNTVNPWQGTVLNDGTDTKPTVGWDAPVGGKLFVWGRSNSPLDGTYATNRNNTIGVRDATSVSDLARRIHVIADDDCLAIYHQNETSSKHIYYFIASPVIPVTNLTFDVPFAVLCRTAVVNSSLWGTFPSAVNENSTTNGGVNAPIPGNVVSAHGDYARLLGDESDTFQPNNQFASTTYTETPVFLYAEENPYKGLIGQLDPFVRKTFRVTYNSTLNSMTRVALGFDSTTYKMRMTLPWDGVTTDPLSGGATGIQF